MVFKEEKYSQVRENIVPLHVNCWKVIRGTDLSKHSTTQKYIENTTSVHSNTCKVYKLYKHISIESKVLITAPALQNFVKNPPSGFSDSAHQRFGTKNFKNLYQMHNFEFKKNLKTF